MEGPARVFTALGTQGFSQGRECPVNGRTLYVAAVPRTLAGM